MGRRKHNPERGNRKRRKTSRQVKGRSALRCALVRHMSRLRGEKQGILQITTAFCGHCNNLFDKVHKENENIPNLTIDDMTELIKHLIKKEKYKDLFDALQSSLEYSGNKK